MVCWENGKDETYMRIVVLDGYTENPGDLSWKGLEDLGDLTVYDRTPKDRVVERIGRAEAVYTNKTPISARTIESCPNLRFIGVLATGYNIVDIHAAGDAGVIVSNIPSYGTDAVAQYAIALLLELCHHVGFHSCLLYTSSASLPLSGSIPFLPLKGETRRALRKQIIRQRKGSGLQEMPCFRF